mmetsp:Transcript_160945/g.516589  ORF Transcript_160945/g.516589 Transcript_160945/m.516589 type:complete len:1006 (-) Transcript_160945:309-3326(-)
MEQKGAGEDFANEQQRDRVPQERLRNLDKELSRQSSLESQRTGSFKEDLQSAKEYFRSASCSDPDGRKWPLWSTDLESLGTYGIGIELYFRFTRLAIRCFAVAALLGVPLLTCNLSGNMLSTMPGSEGTGPLISWLARTTIANLGSSSPNATEVADRRVEMFGQSLDIRGVTMATGLLDALITHVLLVVALWFEFVVIPMVIEAHERTRITPEAFAVAVKGLPRRLEADHRAYEERLRRHFDNLLGARVTQESVAPGLLVVRDSDAGSEEAQHQRSWRCWPFRSGFDARRRRLGRVVGVAEAASSDGAGDGEGCWVEVQWCAVPGAPRERTKCQVGTASSDGELLDAQLLAKLEHGGCVRLATGPAAAEERPVYSVSLVRDFGGQLRRLRKEARQREAQQALSRSTTGCSDGRPDDTEANEAEEVTGELSVGDWAERDVLMAYVVFNRVRHRDFIHDEFSSLRQRLRQQRRLRFASRALRVEDAPTPSDICWENLDFPRNRRRIRRCLVLLSCVILLLTCMLLFSGLKQVSIVAQAYEGTACQDKGAECECEVAGYRNVLKDEPAGVYDRCRPWLAHKIKGGALATSVAGILVAINVACTGGIAAIADAERHLSLTKRSHRIMAMVFLVQLINMGFITAFVHFDLGVHVLGEGIFGLVGNGIFSDLVFEWYVVVGGSILLATFFQTLCPLLGLTTAWVGKAKRCCCSRRQKTSRQLRELYTPPHFELAMQHAQQLCVIFVAVMFSAGMPLLLAFLPVCLTLYYWVDKYVLLRTCRVPPRYSYDLARWTARLLPCALWLHSILAIWVYGHPEVAPSYRIDCDWCRAVEMEPGAVRFVKPLVHRVQAASALPSAVVAAFLTLFLAVRLIHLLLSVGWQWGIRALFFTLGIKTRRRRRREQAAGSVIEGAFRGEALQELRRLKVEHSYELTDAPEYAFLRESFGERVDLAEPGLSPSEHIDMDTLAVAAAAADLADPKEMGIVGEDGGRELQEHEQDKVREETEVARF